MKIIETLSIGFNTVARKLWLLFIPIALDLFYMLGPKLSIVPVIQSTIADLEEAFSSLGAIAELDPTAIESLDLLSRTMEETVGGANIFSLLSWGRMGVPSTGTLQLVDPAVDTIIEVHTVGQMMGAYVLLFVVGLFVATLFLGMIGQLIRTDQINLKSLAQSLPRHFFYILALLIPLGLLLMAITLTTAVLGPLAFIAWVLGLWVLLYVSFVPQAITLAEATPGQALVASFAVVKTNFWPTLAMLTLVNLINMGLAVIWRGMLGSGIGATIAILCNAYIGTSLTVAVFLFFRDRLALWHASVSEARSA